MAKTKALHPLGHGVLFDLIANRMTILLIAPPKML
jgi:hypothetical protein